jgi:HNH endonuclease
VLPPVLPENVVSADAEGESRSAAVDDPGTIPTSIGSTCSRERRRGSAMTNGAASVARPIRWRFIHIVPLAQGGDKYDLQNLVTLCHDCHVAVGGGRTIVGRRRSHPQASAWRNTHAERNTKQFQPDNDLEPLVG